MKTSRRFLPGVIPSTGHSRAFGLADFLLGRVIGFSQGSPQVWNARDNMLGLYVQENYHASKRLTLMGGLRWSPYFVPYDIYGRSSYFDQGDFTAGLHSAKFNNAPPGSSSPGTRFRGTEPSRGPGRIAAYGTSPLGLVSPGIQRVRDFGVCEHPTAFSTGIRKWHFLKHILTSRHMETRSHSPAPQEASPLPMRQFPVAIHFLCLFRRRPMCPSLPPVSSTLCLCILTRPIRSSGTFRSSGRWEAICFSLRLISGTNPLTAGWGFRWILPCTYPARVARKPCSTTGNTQSRRVLSLINPTAGALIGSVPSTYDGANADYNGLLLSANRRFSGYFSVLANYTYSHCLSEGEQNAEGGSGSIQDPSNIRASRGNCISDVRQIFNLSYLAMSPHFENSLMNKVFSNWQQAGIMGASTGTWLTPLDGQDISLTECWERPPQFGRKPPSK